jgi:hypothetical protein
LPLDELWLQLASDAVLHTCLDTDADCRVDIKLYPRNTDSVTWWAELEHVGADIHNCELCSLRHIVSVERLQRTRREDLLAQVVRWLRHFHPEPAAQDQVDAAAEAG